MTDDNKDKEAEYVEKRTESQRVPIQLLVDYQSSGGNFLFDFCKDLGTGGIFIQTAEPLDQGETIELTFTLPDSKETLKAKGKVIWVQHPLSTTPELTPGMGVQFDGFDTDQRKSLEQFIERYQKSSTEKNAS